jgi:hypothetical protein
MTHKKLSNQIDEAMAVMKSHINNMNNPIEQTAIVDTALNGFKTQAVSVACTASVYLRSPCIHTVTNQPTTSIVSRRN